MISLRWAFLCLWLLCSIGTLCSLRSGRPLLCKNKITTGSRFDRQSFRRFDTDAPEIGYQYLGGQDCVVYKYPDAYPSFLVDDKKKMKKTSTKLDVPVDFWNVENGWNPPPALKLIIGAGGIYAAFLYYGTLQEDVFHYTSAAGVKFKAAWFLQSLEALANVILGGVGMMLAGGTKNLPQKEFALSGATQVCAKAFTSLALASGVSFPVVTLAKSGKMVPVMVGSLLLGGASYTLREYLSVASIIAGTCIVSMGKKSSGKASSLMGIIFIILSLTCDGITGGVQNRLKKKSKEMGVVAKPYDFMFWTNLYMGITAFAFALGLNELGPGIKFCLENPVILSKIVKFSLCSAVGQSFIFYTIANFDPLVCTTVTTTRKVFSVLLSIFLNGHQMSSQGWGGIGIASAGIMSELLDKGGKGKGGHGDKKEGKKN